LANSALVGWRSSGRCGFRLSIKLRCLPLDRFLELRRKRARRSRAE
jgi:hypothetical protein